MIVGWELVGLAFYLLIGHWWEDHANNAAAIKAFLVNKVADIGLFLGLIIAGLRCAGRSASATCRGPRSRERTRWRPTWRLGGPGPFIEPWARGPSSLHVWLPDAMEGPTPVCA